MVKTNFINLVIKFGQILLKSNYELFKNDQEISDINDQLLDDEL